MKPKANKGYNTGTYDLCQTPPYALEPLIPYLHNLDNVIWECASGNGTLSKSLAKQFSVIDTDILTGYDFFYNYVIENVLGLGHEYTTIVTNPPYSLKYEWLQRCYYLGFPFALLMPVEMLGAKKAQELFGKYGIEIIFISPRVDFYMPYKKWKGSAQFATAWYTWKLNLPKEINFATLNKPKRSELEEYWNKVLGE